VPDYDPSTALLVVDVQNDFADAKGSLYVRGGERVVPVVNEEIVRALAAGAAVVYTQDWHPEVTPHFQKDGGIWPVHCVAESWGAEFHPDLRIVPDAPVIRKGSDGRDGYSAFSVRDPRSGDVESTRLESLLRERGLTAIAIAGLATDYCVLETALDARRLGHRTAVISEAIRAVELQVGDGDRAIQRIREAGAELV
jgi:nicotinamidase/pyrazinamidase